MKNENMGAEELYLASEETKDSEVIALSDTSADLPSDHKASEKSTELKRIEEIPELRGNNLKVFRMNDGTEQAVFSPSAIHVFDDETHTFEDVETTLIEDEDGRHFTCGKNHFVAKFSREDNNDDIFSIEQGMHKVTVCARKNKKNKNKGVKPYLRKNTKEGIHAADLITFTDVEYDTDYEYSVEGSGVKENIVVKKPAEIYRYPFVLRCENVTAQFDERAKRIAFVSNETGNEVFFIPAPFMTDANGIASTAVNFEMKTNESGAVLLTVTADADWINAPKRAFPVAIDPQIKLSGSTNMSTYSWDNGSLFNASLHTIGTVANSATYAASPACDTDCNTNTSNSMRTAISIALNSWKNGTIGCSGDEVWYKFVANSATAHSGGGAGQYTIYTQGSLDTMGYLYDSNGNLVASNDDCNGLNFSITATLNYGATYYLKVKAWSSNTGSYSVIIAPSINNIDSCTTCFNANRMYMSFAMPTLPRNPRIKKAELQVFQSSSVSEYGTYPLFGLYQVNDEICTGACTPIDDSNLIDYARMRMGHCEDGEVISYTFDITTLVDKINKNESYYPQLVLKLLDESITSQNNITLYGSSYGGDYAPKLVITYESSYGVNTSYRTHTHELGRFGQGSVDLQCGNLMFESEDFAWSGNRMPVTIKHLFNSALAGYTYTNNSAIKLSTAVFSAMKLGYGFKLNLMQSMVASTFVHEGNSYSGYVYVGENGEETFFKKSDTQVCRDSNSQCYNLFEDVNGGDMLYDPEKRTLKQGEDTYQFDASGRLNKISDATEKNHIVITYTSNRITSVTDGAGREFGFTYNTNGQLLSIVAPDRTAINYTYTGYLLTGISYPDGKKAVIAYSSSKPTSVTLKDANGAQVYKVAYSFSGNRLYSVTEYGSDNTVGAKSTYSYSVASARTLVTTTEQKDADEGETANNVITTTYTFDDDGNIVSEYVYSTDTGKVGGDGEESGINPHSGDGGAGIVSNINNLLTGHNFESLTSWSEMPANCGDLRITNYTYEPYAKFGKTVLRMQSYNANCGENGVYQVTNTLPKGQYTFSTYLRVLSAFSGIDAGAFIRVTDTTGNVLGVSEHLVKYDSEYTRLIVPFELTTAQSVQVQILVNGKGTIYADAAQLENNPYANAYNMLENGNFERGTDSWECPTGGVYCSTDTRFNMSKSLYMSGDVSSDRYAYQAPAVRTTRSTRETFTLSGWAKGYGLPNHDREDVTDAPRFRLRAEIRYYDTAYREYGTEEFTADFSPATEEWQFASVQFSKSKYRTIQYIRVYCDYGYNSGTVYFDDVQLVRNSLETYLSASDFVVESTGTSDDAAAEATDTTPTFNEAKDKFGNALTETTFTDGDFGTIYRSFAFTSDCNCAENAGNDLISETDARGNKTYYTVDEDTSKNEEVTDRLGNKTAYEYDNSGRTTKVTGKDADGTELANVSYAYDTFDNMTEIVRGDGMKYALAYNEFHNLESIGIEGKDEKLIQYTYKNGNGRLKEMKYANGDTMKATYNSIGQMVGEKWLNSNGAEIARYKYVYDGDGNIVRSIDISGKKEYNYEYEEGRIVRTTEADIALNDEIVTSKVIVNTVKYYYDTEGKMTKKVITPASGSAQTIYYETNDDNTVVKFSAGSRTVTSHSKTDSFGRKVFDELQLGTDFVSRQFVYHAGKVTDTHKEKAKVKSSATTQLVSQIILSNGTTLSYGYDAEERITTVVETYTVDETPVTNTTIYTYDALGQLLTETVNGEVVNTMKYDNYGNIVEKNGKAYIYGNAMWKDLLAEFDGKAIEYDAQGNPVKYLGHTLTWEKGRQLKKFDNIEYTYNANGIRTSKKVNGVLHTYTLDGTKILREVWDSNTLVPLYDNEDGVCGILYNNIPYYFIKNLQGDVIAIVDKDAQTVARYSYDAWGICSITQDSVGIATINPFRYRGYYYDEEIELYYLQSRYYDAIVGRFINADDSRVVAVDPMPINISLYTYCQNEPVFNSDPNGYWVLTLGVSWGIAFLIGINIFATLLIDSSWDYGLFLGATLLTGFAAKGLSGSFGFYWGFNRIQNYLNSVTVGFAAGYVVGGTLVYDYYKYPSSKKRFVGIQISYGTTGLYRESAPFDGGIYIPLKAKLKKFLSSCGSNIFKLKNKIKNLKIKISK